MPGKRIDDFYMDRLGKALGTPDAEELAFFEALRPRGGAVGDDDQGRYVRTLPGGAVIVLRKRTAASDVRSPALRVDPNPESGV